MSEQHPLLTLAQAIAVVAHKGIYRKGDVGEPYFNHCQRVADEQPTWRRKVLAYLHDTVEDTPVTLQALIDVGFPLDIVQDVAALSRHIYGQEEYTAFIERGCREGSIDALLVKLADLTDNLSDCEAVAPGLSRRYQKAIVTVRDEIEKRVHGGDDASAVSASDT